MNTTKGYRRCFMTTAERPKRLGEMHCTGRCKPSKREFNFNEFNVIVMIVKKIRSCSLHYTQAHTDMMIETTNYIPCTLRMPEYNYMGTQRLVYATRGLNTEHKLDIS